MTMTPMILVLLVDVDVVDESGWQLVVEETEGGPVARACGAHQRVVGRRFGCGLDSHSLTFHARGSKVKDVSQVKAHWR